MQENLFISQVDDLNKFLFTAFYCIWNVVEVLITYLLVWNV